MNRTLDVALVKQLKELLGTSGKRIAVYFKEGAAWPQIISVYQNEAPPTRHPNHRDFTFAGWADLKTGEVRNDLTVDTGAKQGITWRMVGMAILGLFIWTGKILLWSLVGMVMIIGMFAGVGGHSGGHRSRMR